jgi:nitrogen fixation/metabolism regulation signal transduction histidine kinase
VNDSTRDQDIIVKPVITNLPVAIIVVNKDRRVMLSNKAAEFISGKTEGQMFNLRGGDVLGCIYAECHKDGCGYSKECDGCQVRTAVLDAFREKTSKTLLDTNMVLKEIGKRDLKVSATYINIDDMHKQVIESERRKSLGRRQSDFDKELVIVSVEDVTEFKRREKLAAVMETVGAACHEMNNPLQAITGNIDLIRMDIKGDLNPDKITRMIDKIEDAAQRLNKITVQLMNLKAYETKSYLSGKILDVEKSAK